MSKPHIARPSITPSGSHKVSLRNCVRAFGLQRAETSFANSRWRAQAARAHAGKTAVRILRFDAAAASTDALSEWPRSLS